MKLLFKREQTTGRVGRVQFRLWGKVELTEEEQEIVKRYRFDQAILIEALQPALIRNSLIIGLIVAVVASALFIGAAGSGPGIALGLLAGGGTGYWWFNEKRETIYVRDLIHGRHFRCTSVIELARKEAWLSTVTAFLRQVMESAKHWDGTETNEIEALPKAEAKLVMLKGL
ncbi:MAG: hypothetical protein RID91_03595 [Azospirillaceae bacterium]